MAAYYNEIDAAAAHLLRCLIKDGVIAPGDVDERSIKDVQPEDLRGYTQVHFFAGGGLWSVAARLAGWPDDRPLWTGSCPCQPFSVAGKGAAESDPRHLWPDMFRLISACRPAVVMGEQVAGKAGYGWLNGVQSDLAGEGYASRGVDIPAVSVDAPHIRSRLYWCASDMADANRARRLDDKQAQNGRQAAATHKPSRGDVGDADRDGPQGHRRSVEQHDAERRQEPNGCFAEAGLAYRNKDVDNAASTRCSVAGCDAVGSSRNEAWWEGLERRGCDGFDVEHSARKPEGAFRSLQKGQKSEFTGRGCRDMADAERAERWAGSEGRLDVVDRESAGRQEASGRCELHRAANGTFWSDHEWRTGADGKSRRAQPGVRLLVDGFPNRVAALRIAGNAIVPQVAAEVIRAFMDVEGVDGGII